MSDIQELVLEIRDLKHWKNGDGAVGAERRLQLVETRTQDIQRQCQDRLPCAQRCSENTEQVEDLTGKVSEIAHAQEDMMTQENVSAITDKLKIDIITAIRAEKKKGIEKMKAWAPYFASLCTVAAAILLAVLKR